MRDVTPHIRSAGAQLVVVGNGSVEQAGWFVEDYGIETPVFTDPTLSVYQVIGAKRGVMTLLHPRAFVNRFRALRKGFRQSKTMGSKTQQGGVLIVMPDGSIPYRYLASASGDHPKPRDVLAALNGVVGSRA